MTNTQIKTSIDNNITNKTIAKSIDNTLVGEDIKSIVDYVDQEIITITSGQRELSGTILQASTSIPVITEFKNDFIGETITIERISSGLYTISISGLVPDDYLNKSYCLIGSGNNPLITRNEITVGSDGAGGYNFVIYSIDISSGNTPADSLLARTSFQIIIKD